MAVLTDDEKELGVALSKWAAARPVAFLHEGKIRTSRRSNSRAPCHERSGPGLSVTQSDAERLKERHGAAYTPL
jgi:hypothetical protein